LNGRSHDAGRIAARNLLQLRGKAASAIAACASSGRRSEGPRRADAVEKHRGGPTRLFRIRLTAPFLLLCDIIELCTLFFGAFRLRASVARYRNGGVENAKKSKSNFCTHVAFLSVIWLI
jgi:hypothetical protein